MTTSRVLVTCDDMGYHPCINDAIIEVLGRSLVKSVSLMATGPHFDDAVAKLHRGGIERVGVHLALAAEYPNLPMRPVSDPQRVSSLVDERGCFFAGISSIRREARISEVREEVLAQIARIRGAGFGVSHVDGHMFWYERDEGGVAMHNAVAEICDQQDLPLRSRSAHRSRRIDSVRMYWDGNADIDGRLADYRAFFTEVRPGLSELIVHPGDDPAALATFTRTGHRRIADYRFFTDPGLPRWLSALGIEIVGWSDIAR